ncbi:MAG: FtsX-like permease family protein [Candidatus Solibacter usitatus]|nr:FtsX-like permease family protein [Candidatus Solibacter usitatus]
MASLALRNLFHDKVRLAVTLTGIVFAIVLIIIQLGLFLGFTDITSMLVQHSAADLWIAARGVTNLDSGRPFSESKLYQALATPGVASAEKYIVQFAVWKRPDGSPESCEVVGFNPDSMTGGPWNLIEGSAAALKTVDTVILDDFYRKKLGVARVGDTAEINGHRARVVGFTKGIRAFTTSPHVFTAYKNALNYTRVGERETVYVLVKAMPGVAPAELKRRLAARLSDVDLYTTAEWARKTTNYWMFTTGAGGVVLMAAVMGLLVGLVVVAQTIYATTMDHLREFGTLKAMGASNGYIYRVIVKQAVASALLGYTLALAISIPVVRLSRQSSALILLPWELGLLTFGIAVMMCVAASVVSINKVTAIDPAMVFKS